MPGFQWFLERIKGWWLGNFTDHVRAGSEALVEHSPNMQGPLSVPNTTERRRVEIRPVVMPHYYNPMP